MPDTVTVTGKTGPNVTVTTVVINEVTEVKIDTINSVLFVNGKMGNTTPRVYDFDIKAQDTVTVTKSGLDWTITIAA